MAYIELDFDVTNVTTDVLGFLMKHRGETLCLNELEFRSFLNHPSVSHILGQVIAGQILNGVTSLEEQLWLLDNREIGGFECVLFNVNIKVTKYEPAESI